MKELATTHHKGVTYIIDMRLLEFRPIDTPWERVPFDSDLCREIEASRQED